MSRVQSLAVQAQVEEAVAGEAPQIVRNAGGGGARDLHLEDFSVSNGGPELIENASVIMAFGRRCACALTSLEGLGRGHSGHCYSQITDGSV